MSVETPYKPVYIDGQPWAVRLPQGGSEKGENSEWDDILARLGRSNKVLHWKDIFSWCQDEVKNFSANRTLRGHYSPDFMSDAYPSYGKSPSIGFRPILIPLDKKTLYPDPFNLSYVPDGEVLRMGSLCIDGEVAHFPFAPLDYLNVPDFEGKSDLSFGDTISGQEDTQLRFIKCGDFLVADRNLVRNISWDKLDELDFTYGLEKGFMHADRVSCTIKLRYCDPQYGLWVESEQAHITYREDPTGYDGIFCFNMADYDRLFAAFKRLISAGQNCQMDFEVRREDNALLYFARIERRDGCNHMEINPVYAHLDSCYEPDLALNSHDAVKKALELVYGGFHAAQIDSLGHDHERRERTESVQLYRKGFALRHTPGGIPSILKEDKPTLDDQILQSSAKKTPSEKKEKRKVKEPTL